MSLIYVFNINKDIIQVSNNKDIKFFSQDFIDVSLETCRYIE